MNKFTLDIGRKGPKKEGGGVSGFACALVCALECGFESGSASGSPALLRSVSQRCFCGFSRVLRTVSNAVAFRVWSIPSVVLVDLLDLAGISGWIAGLAGKLSDPKDSIPPCGSKNGEPVFPTPKKKSFGKGELRVRDSLRDVGSRDTSLAPMAGTPRKEANFEIYNSGTRTRDVRVRA